MLLTRVQGIKSTEARHFAIVDGAMNDLLRPALYDAWLDILPVLERHDSARETYDIVGPVCETGDFLGKQRRVAVEAGDLLAVMGAGAYGFTMASNYNSKPRAAETLVRDGRAYLIRARESFEDLIRGEVIPR